MIPYYEKNTGILRHEESNILYVVLDKTKVDDLSADIWHTFNAVKLQVEKETKEYLYLSDAILALSPDGDETYVLNFISDGMIPNEGAII